jgi:hypothetical protein
MDRCLRQVDEKPAFLNIGRDYEWELMPLGLDQKVGVPIMSSLSRCEETAEGCPCTIPNCDTSRLLRYYEMAKKESEKKALKAIDKAVRKAIKSGIRGGLVDQTVATAIHAATVKAARKADTPAE